MNIEAMIEENRKGNFIVHLKGVAPGTSVSYKMRRLGFDLGTVLYRSWFMLAEANSDRQHYLETIDRYFNHILIPFFWHILEPRQAQYNDQPYLAIYQWAEAHSKTTLGHSIFYGADEPDDADPADGHLNFIQPWLRQLQPAQLEAAMKRHLARVLDRFGNKISEYVLVNEVLGKTDLVPGNYYNEVLGYSSVEPYFRWAEEVAPNAKFYLNENSIMFGRKTDGYVHIIRSVLDAGLELGGIGIQGHMMTDTIPTEEMMWSQLEALATFDLPIRITEFGVQTADQEHYAQDMYRFYRLCFAHPAVVGITRWGFWEPEMWNRTWPVQEAPLWTTEWSPTPAASVYEELIDKEWTTAGHSEVDAQGQLQFRGFFGTYQLDVAGASHRIELTRSRQDITVDMSPHR